MALQFITASDGSVPPGTDVAALLAAGVLLVRPTLPPIPGASQVPRDARDPTQTLGVWYQRWTLDSLPPPPPVRVITPRQFLDRLGDARTAAVLAAVMSAPMGVLWYSRLMSAPTVNLDSTDMRNGLAFLRSAGVLTAADVATLIA